MLALLPDGSYLTRIGGLPLRVIEAEIHSRTADGGDFGGTYRLLTTLNDHRTDPADHLVRLYHERWEIEITYLLYVTPFSEAGSYVRRTRWVSTRRCGDCSPSTRPCARSW
ncbi:hypothetical protein OG298_00720 [Streptomyces sp. NBC_01005]|uniref:hypothetical protein n=1 Tax=unclassified Streptomyces TaxID=2593676 RepID=UPI002E36F6AB|nr:hypothetical protein [Streptomyces sp. NBC_01362]WSW03012.1 hypothetical protein OG298_00720 [Streptomyces sp. NBC_01005]WTC92519.1 hypothetical protein OH736_00725 [Streptomyces sp. NBC_01650]